MIREFRCDNGHTSERILTRAEDAALAAIPCFCGKSAQKLEFSVCGFLLMPGGGGFQHPHAREGSHGRPPITTGGGKNLPRIPGVTVGR